MTTDAFDRATLGAMEIEFVASPHARPAGVHRADVAA
jgi:hypothetical protein